ncbi:MAG: hypothetical protein ACXADY_01990 [Candidatus Hodarchaeales archaeon]|jgi:hypothetical protein
MVKLKQNELKKAKDDKNELRSDKYREEQAFKEKLIKKVKTIQSGLKRHKINSDFYQRFPDSIRKQEEQIQNFDIIDSIQELELWIRITLNLFIERESSKIRCLWPDCTKEISRKHPDLLRAHISKHLGWDDKINSPYCTLEFSDKSNLKRHIKRKHPLKLNKTLNNDRRNFFNHIDVKNAVLLWDCITGIIYDRFCKKYTRYLFNHDFFKNAREIIADAQHSLKSGKKQFTMIPDITIYNQDYQISFLDFKKTLNTFWVNPSTLNYIIEYYPTSTLVLCFLDNDFSNSQDFKEAAIRIIKKVLKGHGISPNKISEILERITIWLVEEDFYQLIPVSKKSNFLQELNKIKSMNITHNDIVFNVQLYLENLNKSMLDIFKSYFPKLNEQIIKQDIEIILNENIGLYKKIKLILILEDIIKSKYVTSNQISKRFSINQHRANQYLSILRKLGILKHVKFYRNYLSFYKYAPEPNVSQVMHFISPLAKIGYQELIKRKFITQKELDELVKDTNKRFFASITIYGLILIHNIKLFLPKDIKFLILQNFKKYSILVNMNEKTIKTKLTNLTSILALKTIPGYKKRTKGDSGYDWYYFLSDELTFIEALKRIRPEEEKAIQFLLKKSFFDKKNLTEDYLKEKLGTDWHYSLYVLNSLIYLSKKHVNQISLKQVNEITSLLEKNVKLGLKILIESKLVIASHDGNSKYGNLILI